MNRKLFTQEEITLLWQNPYTLSVNEREINFTPEFKEAFLKLYKDGSTAPEAVTALGYDPDLLGRSRIRNFFKTFSGQKVAARKQSSPSSDTGEKGLDSRIKQLEFQVRYMKAELEFLKKNFSSNEAPMSKKP